MPHLRSDEDLRDAHRNAADAKARIAIYGSASVISALARFAEAGAVISDEHTAQAFVCLVLSMRESGTVVPDRDLELLIVGSSKQDNTRGGDRQCRC